MLTFTFFVNWLEFCHSTVVDFVSFKSTFT